MRYLLGAVGLLLAAAVGFGAWYGLMDRTARPPGPPLSGPMAGFELKPEPAPAPEISFSDAAGNSLGLGDFRGKVVLLNLWATWCPPCVREMPSLDRLQAALGGAGLQVIPLSIDREGAAVVTPFFERLGIAQLGVYLDPAGAALRAYAARGLPTTALIDREGRLVGLYAGGTDWDTPAAMALVRHYLDPAPQRAERPERAGGA